MNKSKGPLLNGILNFPTTFIHILKILRIFSKSTSSDLSDIGERSDWNLWIDFNLNFKAVIPGNAKNVTFVSINIAPYISQQFSAVLNKSPAEMSVFKIRKLNLSFWFL